MRFYLMSLQSKGSFAMLCTMWMNCVSVSLKHNILSRRSKGLSEHCILNILKLVQVGCLISSPSHWGVSKSRYLIGWSRHTTALSVKHYTSKSWVNTEVWQRSTWETHIELDTGHAWSVYLVSNLSKGRFARLAKVCLLPHENDEK